MRERIPRWRDLRLSSWLLFNLQRHADHHQRPGVAYPWLGFAEGAPLLPAGYVATIFLALIPPLWFFVMNPRVERWRLAQPPLPVAA